MRNKKMLFMAILLFMMVLSIGAISAQDVDDAIVSSGNDTVLTESNSVSGGVDFVTENPWNTTGELSYDIPSDAKTIKSADVYVNVYGGSATNDWGAIANITVTTDYDVTFTENLWIPEGSTDGTVYPVNDHITKCYSDYMIHYDITNMLDGLNGTNLKINVDSFEYPDKKFDGRIKLIALILAYDDGDDDTIGYWINDNQLWTKQSFDVDYNVTNLLDYMEATLKNVVLSSGDGSYKFNDDYLGDADYHYSGDYYQYNEWNVTGLVKPNQPNTLTVDYAGTSTYGSIKNALSLLTINMIPVIEEVSLTPEYTSVPSAYAGTNNTLTIKVKTAKAGTYDIQLFADAVEVDAKTVDLVEGVNTIYLTDPTIRPIDASTVSGAVHEKVEYSAVVFYDSYPLYLEDITLPVLYNGNLGSDYEYNITGFEDFGSFDINGEFIIDIKDASTYMGASVMNRTDVWAVNLVDNAEITNAFIYVPYNWFNAKSYTEGVDMFDATFNSNTVTPIAWYRDQGNLGNYGNYGYGVFVYDVSDLIAIGDNSFVLNKINPTPAVYPSVLVYMYNVTGSEISRTIYVLNGADLLSNSNNVAKRVAEANTEINVDISRMIDATLCVLAASAQAGESDIVFNGEVYSDVWAGTSSSSDLFVTDVTSLIANNNSISFVATGSTIMALPQFILISKDIKYDTNLTAVYDSATKDLVVTLVDSITGAPLKGANVVVNIAGDNTKVRIAANGEGRLSLADLDYGTYATTLTYKGNANYYPNTVELDIDVVKAAVNLSAVYDSISKELVVSLVDAVTGAPLKGANVVVNIAGDNTKVRIAANGEGRLSLADLDYGTYATTLTYKGNAIYDLTAVELDIDVVKAAVNLSAVYDSISKELVVSLVDAVTGAPLKGANVIVNIAGEKYTVRIKSNGEGRLSLADLDYGTYAVSLTYKGNAMYALTTVDLDVIVKDAVDLSAVYDSGADELVVSLVDAVTGAPLKGANVVVNINEDTYKVRITSTGQGKLSLAELSPGTYTANATYKGNSLYAPSTIPVDIVKKASDF